MKIRVAGPEDKDTVFKFLDKTLEITIWKDFYPDLNKERLVESFLNPNTHSDRMVLFLLDDSDTEVGMASFDAYAFPDSHFKVARLRSIFLEEEHRGKGVMSMVLDTLHYWAEKVGCSYINLGAAEGVDLEKHGYKLMEKLYIKDIR